MRGAEEEEVTRRILVRTPGKSTTGSPRSRARIAPSQEVSLRIGVDARKLRDGGIGTYIRNLLGVFVGRPEGHEFVVFLQEEDLGSMAYPGSRAEEVRVRAGKYSCLLYTSDAADERSSVDLGGRRII